MRASIHRLLARAKKAIIDGEKVTILTVSGEMPVADVVFDIDTDEPIEIWLASGGCALFEAISPPVFVIPR